MPLPYNRVSVQNVAFPFNKESIQNFFQNKICYFRTDYIVLRQNSNMCIVSIKKNKFNAIFSKITEVELLSTPEKTHFVEIEDVDTANRSEMSSLFRKEGYAEDQFLVVKGAFGHINFISGSGSYDLKLLDNSPPTSRLLDLVQKVLQTTNLPPIQLTIELNDIEELSKQAKNSNVLLPCEFESNLSQKSVFYLDQHPPILDWALVGCDRSLEIHSEFYGCKPSEFLNTCPLLKKDETGPTIRRCCRLDRQATIFGKHLTVPWGSDFEIVRSEMIKLFPVLDCDFIEFES